ECLGECLGEIPHSIPVQTTAPRLSAGAYLARRLCRSHADPVRSAPDPKGRARRKDVFVEPAVSSLGVFRRRSTRNAARITVLLKAAIVYAITSQCIR